MAREKIHWGVVGCGAVAASFVRELLTCERAVVRAFADAIPERARDYAEQFRTGRACGCCDELMTDPQVDVVYVATPHNSHREHTLAALDAGKAVLCEKTLAPAAADAREMIAVARAKGLFLMEGLWARCFPLQQQVLKWIAQKRVGEYMRVCLEFSLRVPFDPNARHFDPALCGGALLDTGVYPVSMARFYTGKDPVDILSNAYIGPTGVDEYNNTILIYDDASAAILSSAIGCNGIVSGDIFGPSGHIEMDSFIGPTKITLHLNDGEPETHTDERKPDCWGYYYEADEVMDCLLAGKTESGLVPLDDTPATIETMDKMRAQWRLT